MTDDIRGALARYADATPHLDPRDGLGDRLARRDRRHRLVVAGAAAVAVSVAGAGVVALTRLDDRAGLVVAGPGGDGVVTADGPHGLRVRVSLTPERLPTATVATLSVHATDDDGQPQVTAIAWGDGYDEPVAVEEPECGDEPPPAAPGVRSASYPHAWRNPGEYAVAVTVGRGPTCAPSAPEQVTVTVRVRVGPGEARSNGPAEPEGDAHITFAGDDTGYRRELSAGARDLDGHLSAIVVDWGDGSAPLRRVNPAPCADGGGWHYPVPQGFGIRERHVFPRRGPVTVTVTYVSAGCDGRDEQTTVQRLPLVVAPPGPDQA